MAKHRSYSIEFERQVAQEYIAAQFPVVLALIPGSRNSAGDILFTRLIFLRCQPE